MAQRIIVAHPFKQHSFKLASALENEGLLLSYITTVYDKPHSITHLFSRLVGGSYRKKVQAKKCDDLDNLKVIQFCEVQGLFFLSMIRIPVVKLLYRAYGRHLCRKFGMKVARYAIKNKADVVVMYDTTACFCFEYIKAKAPAIKCVLDVSSIPSMSRTRIYESIMAKEESKALYIENKHLWNKQFNDRNAKEIIFADYFLSPSSFVSNCLVDCGAKEEQIIKLPYGVDTTRFHRTELKSGSPLRLVYTGSVLYGKGINYLILLASELKDIIHIDVFGGSMPSDEHNICFHGFVSQDALCDYYKNAHLFVFPSLGDGFGLAALEAMASGLPIVCSSNSGIEDIVENGVNGYVFKAGDYDELKALIIHLSKNSDLLSNIGLNAWKTAQSYTWKAYFNKAVSIFTEI